MAEENEELLCPRPVLSMVVQGFRESPFPRSHQGHKVKPLEEIKISKTCSSVVTEQEMAATKPTANHGHKELKLQPKKFILLLAHIF